MQPREPSVTQRSPVLVQSCFLAPAHCNEVIDAFRVAARASDQVLTTPYRTEMAAWLAVEDWSSRLSNRLGKIRERAQQAVHDFYDVADGLHLEYTLFSEMHVGDAHPLHADAERREPSGHWSPNHTPWRHSVAILYLNTSGVDFGGGELVFPALGRQVPPRAGQLVAFRSTHEYCHEVTRITRGSRCALAMWMTQDADYREGWGRDP